MIERHQNRGGIRRATAEATSHRNALGQGDVNTERTATCLGERMRGANAQVIGRRHCGRPGHAHDLAIIARSQMHFVQPVD
jgi:hypothetical protein